MNTTPKSIFLLLLLFSQIAFISSSCGQTSDSYKPAENADSKVLSDGETETKRILFLGNSYTFYNDLPEMITEISNTVDGEIKIEAQQITIGGATLSRHYNSMETIGAIKNGNWDYVVLQEQSTRPMESPDQFFESVEDLSKIIKASGAETILFMTWAKKHNPNSIKEISTAYWSACKKYKTLIAPVGLAWENCRKEYPQIELYNPDGSHPSMAGSYLAACVFYSILSNEEAVIPIKGIDSKTGTVLQKVAWDACHENK